MYAVYATSAGDRRIHVLDLDPASGKLKPLQVIEVPGPHSTKPISLPLAVRADQRRIYTAIRTAPYPSSTFAVDPKTGRLKLLGTAELTTDGMCSIMVDPRGGHLLAASFTGSSITIAPIGADTQVGSPPTSHLRIPGAHCVISSDDGRFVYVASHADDMILQFELDRARGRLVPTQPVGVALDKGAGPRHIIIHTATNRMYSVNEKSGSVDMLAIDPRTGNLSRLSTVTMLPAGYDAASSSADIHITRDGRFLYASERTKSFLVSYAVDAAGGTLTPIEWVDTEECPRGFAISPDDKFLLCTGELSGGISVYAIDGAGKLKRTDQLALGPVSTWVEVLHLA